MKLRSWQKACSDSAFNKYLLGQQHFLCLATPGAGKTIMAADVARRLLEAGKIDYIFCFSPSVATSKGMQDTLESMLHLSFSGLIGSKGVCVTYQSLSHKNQKFWDLFRKYRVFAIFDEIHHCGGNQVANANAWATQILLNIQSHATYTLALSGTPWRSDNRQVTLSRYKNINGDIHCDYEYGLAEAINDRVCRVPKITVIDNKSISFTDDSSNTNSYTSIQDLLKNESISYQALVETDAVMDFSLQEAVKQLTRIRKQNPNAAGLVVASTIEHAERIAKKLKVSFGASVSTVSYKNAESDIIIDGFQTSTTQWLVSVGMVSEGTNIPRLQACCHLTKIKTKLHFRQVLGRIIRLTKTDKLNDAFLFAPAQLQLIDYAKRLHADIPDEVQFVKTVLSDKPLAIIGTDDSALPSEGSVGPPLQDLPEVSVPTIKESPTTTTTLLDDYFGGLCFNGTFYTELVRSQLSDRY